jgi:hypothetical protein
MSNNIPILIVGGAIAEASVYFLTKSKDSVEEAKKRLDKSVVGGRMRLRTISSQSDPPIKGAAVAEVCNVKRASTWSKETPQFMLDCDSGIVPGFTHTRSFIDQRSGSPYKGMTLFQPGPNPGAEYPSEFLETSQGIASILGTIGQAAGSIFTAQSQFSLEKDKLKMGGRRAPAGPPPAPIIVKESNTAMIALVLVGGLGMAGMMYYMMNQGA